MLTDFFVATFAEVDSINSNADLKSFPVVYAKRVDPLKIAVLEGLLTGNVEVEIAEPIKELESGEGWVFPIGKRFAESLSRKSPEDLSKIASDWAETDEWQIDNANQADLIELLKSLKTLARQTGNEDKAMFLLLSL